jgi:hypothetical protein
MEGQSSASGPPKLKIEIVNRRQTMRFRLVVVLCAAFALMFLPSGAAGQNQTVRQVQLTRSGPLPGTPPISANAMTGPELDSALAGDDNDDSDGNGPGISVNRGI